MLFTRCPDCETTFRVTDETLKKANGQVRCGRCASVFNAYAELQDPAGKSFEPNAPSPAAAARRPSEPAAAPHAPEVPAASIAAAKAAPSAAATTAATEDLRARSVDDVAAEVAIAEAKAPAEDDTTDFDLITAKQVDEVLASPPSTPPPEGGTHSWRAFGVEPASQVASRWWGVAAALAVLTLGAQTVHHFRADVAGHATFGPLIQRAYAMVGVELAPRWDVRQYQILDWVATAEPNERGLGSLKIAARIKNNAPLGQPYPAVQLRLKDRWEKAVSSRLFGPAEYLPRNSPHSRLMSPGETTRAEIEVVDPGPDAYGFELDVCIEVEASLVTCGTDKVFL